MIYNLRSVEKMMKYFSPIGNINGIDLYIVSIEVHFYLSLVSYLGQSNILKSVSCVKKLAVDK